jgi:hypothetical protein
MSNTNTGAMKQLRGPEHENWPVCDPRAAPPGEYGLKSGENGHLARPNGAIDGPYCSPAWPSVCGRRCEPLAGRGGGLGAELHQRPHAARGALLQFDCRIETRGTKTVRHCGGGRPGRGGSAACSREARGRKAVAFHNPQALAYVQEEGLSCARDQVVIARPLVLTPTRRYRRSLVSKGRFTISINVFCA